MHFMGGDYDDEPHEVVTDITLDSYHSFNMGIHNESTTNYL
ncbi:hypothetical protein VAE308_230003 [Vibrio aestuarianus]|nr:hypothetical protein VAE142_760002 [Vibrio aestuarianus]CAH8232984.1 hypothetical protein VAE308_230003 [Vibrio aestuarianus]